VIVASEPGDDEPGWVDVPDQSLVEASAGSVIVRPIGAAVLTTAAAGGDSNGRTTSP
jgi:glutamine amidotransferase